MGRLLCEHGDDLHRTMKRIGELSGSAFSEGDLALGSVVKGEYRCILERATSDGDEMHASTIGMF